MELSIDVLSTLETSLKYSILKIENFDYSYGRHDPSQYQFYRQCRKEALEPLLKAKQELKLYRDSLKKEQK